MTVLSFVLVFIAGLVLGGGALWLALKGRVDAARAEARSQAEVELAVANERARGFTAERDALQDTLAQLKADLNAVKAELDAARAERESLRADHGLVSGQLTPLRERLVAEATAREQAERDCASLRSSLSEWKAKYDAEVRQSEEKLALLTQAKDVLSNQFKTLANEILDEKSQKFAEQNKVNLGEILNPLNEKIKEFQGKVEEVYVQEGKDRSALGEQVRQLMELNRTLGEEAKNLTSALKGSNKAQGNWGELILERVLESSGLRKGHEYDTQESHTREDGTRAQPDVVLHLPGDRHIVIDAKVSLIGYEQYVTAEDDGVRAGALKQHLDSVRGHMKGLSDRNYHDLHGVKSLDFVLMFIPIEPAFMLAITGDESLFQEAWTRNVLLVSPSTLLFVVRTVAHLWRQEQQTRNAVEIAKRGAELYDRLSAFVGDLEKLGDRLGQAQDSYNEARNKLYRNKGNVIRQAEMLKQLGVKPSKSLPQAVLDMADDSDALPQIPASDIVVGDGVELTEPL